jgi:hypothetical protein
MQSAVNILDAAIYDNITLTIQVGYNDFNNGQIKNLGTSAVGGDWYGSYVSYDSLRASLASHETSSLDQTFVNSLPSAASVNGVSNFYVPSAVEKALGMISPTASTIDGVIGMGSGVPTSLLVGVALHELTHAMGREPGAATFDLARYTSAGNHLFSVSNTAPAAYFSVDGGMTKLADFGQSSDPSDFLNSGVQGGADPFNEYYSSATTQNLTTVDKQLLDALGFNTTGVAPGAPSASNSTIVASSITVTADGASVTALTVTVRDAGGNAVAGTAVTLSASGASNTFGAISGTTDANGVFTTTLASTLAQTETITATEGSVHEQTSVTFVPGAVSATMSSIVASSPVVFADGTSSTMLTVTVLDAYGNAIGGTAVSLSASGSSDIFGAVSGTTDASGVFTTTLRSTFGQTETITATEGTVHEQTSVTFVAPSVIETSGSTSLMQFGTNFYLYGGGTGPELKYSGAAVVAGQFGGGWAPIAAEQTASGYDVAWKVLGSDQYTVWSTDSNGNFVSYLTGIASGSSTALESLETSFHQDLNGDGTIGVRSTVIESYGSTALTEVANNFYLYTGGAGPELKYFGTAVVDGQFGGGWAPISAEQTASGYVVAAKVSGSDQYTVWSTDGNGNYVSNLTGIVSGSSTALESLETTFHQDLNGDGTIGIRSTVIETNGSVSLTEVGNNFYLYSGGSGPELKYSGAPLVDGQFGGGWAPIGAEQTANGYVLAAKISGSDQFTVWSIDSNGNFVSNLTGIVSGHGTTLEAVETTFHQDLNGDGTIGIRSVTLESDGSTSLTEVGNNFYLYAGGSGPELKYSGVAVVDGQFGGGWTPVAAEQTASGYDVAWKVAGADEYTVWSTDSDGNYVSYLTGFVSGTSTSLESLETTFHHDLNGDGTIGAPVSGTAPALAGTNSGAMDFNGATLTLDAPSTFSGQIVGFAGDGTLQGSDQIDLRGIGFGSIHSSYDSSTGLLLVNDGTHGTDLLFLGSYSQDSFRFADDGRGGTIVYAQTASSQASQPTGASIDLSDATDTTAAHVAGAPGQDTFVFAPQFGQVTLTGFSPETDAIHFNHTIFANIDAVLSATHDDGNGNAVITDATHDTLTLQNVSTAQLLAHQNDFHFV